MVRIQQNKQTKARAKKEKNHPIMTLQLYASSVSDCLNELCQISGRGA